MLNIRSMLSAVLHPVHPADLPPPHVPPEEWPDRIDFDLQSASDTDAMWYYEMRKWRGRD
ncbi:hypothetical protein G5V57_05540 [Nordella sp. HKS 07]|uniref:hypothetical protein n=1 Tax=Nordella sp. HKS 07 TaxID=2712222 RepID=UPI0013E11013|nr:hypothetical protein [Nordella sp. HKS 07]QIG47237.1 hypothetical protein G5V57_05540 [Nordella sp. HKS 07]